MPWKQLSLQCPQAEVERIEAALLAAGAQSVTFEDAEDQPILEPGVNETPLWQHITIKALFDIHIEEPALLQDLKKRLRRKTLPAYTLEVLADQPWERAWLAHFKPVCFGERLWICPSTTPAMDPHAITVTLDPGLAFGTGTHPTTALCLQWLATHTVADKTILDYGAGSGILAIAALKLGAQRAYCVDNDPQALIATHDNAQRNNLPKDVLQSFLPGQLPAVQVDILLANILAAPLIQLAPRFAALLKPGGQLVLSGILAEQIDAIQAAYAPFFQHICIQTKDNWALLQLTQ